MKNAAFWDVALCGFVVNIPEDGILHGLRLFEKGMMRKYNI
jgi:hypothetical protein